MGILNWVDTLSGASTLRDLIAGQPAFDQFSDPGSDLNRVTGREMLRLNPYTQGLVSDRDNILNFLAGAAAEQITDPLALAGALSTIARMARTAKAAKATTAARSVAAELASPHYAGGLPPSRTTLRPYDEVADFVEDSMRAAEEAPLNYVGGLPPDSTVARQFSDTPAMMARNPLSQGGLPPELFATRARSTGGLPPTDVVGPAMSRTAALQTPSPSDASPLGSALLDMARQIRGVDRNREAAIAAGLAGATGAYSLPMRMRMGGVEDEHRQHYRMNPYAPHPDQRYNTPDVNEVLGASVMGYGLPDYYRP